jgi:hypothetical protein
MNWQNMSDITLGTAGVPFTFPTLTVNRHIKETVPSLALTNTQIDSIWEAYKAAMYSGQYKPWRRGMSNTLGRKLITDTGYPAVNIVTWGNAVQELAQAGKINNKWWMVPEDGGGIDAFTRWMKDQYKKAGTRMTILTVLAGAVAIAYFSGKTGFIKRRK